MNSKQQLYFAMQRVMNDMTTRDESIKPIPFMEVARLLAEIGQERAEPELLEATSNLCNLMFGTDKFQVSKFGLENIVVCSKDQDGVETPYHIKDTKESLFHSFLGFLAKEIPSNRVNP